MSQEITELDVLKNNVVKELFLKTADQTYVVARWCFLNRLYLEFYWNGLHAVEKYLKAALLLNGPRVQACPRARPASRAAMASP